MPQSFSIKLHSETQVSGRLGMSAGKSHRHVQNPLSGERRKKTPNNPPCPITSTLTSSFVHHSSHQLTTTFYCITMSLK